ncbi:RDD family protein [Actinomadura barringtoniae]|uniref:RDD family protein n=1 Tax=Actinomadura barringtoniae TaxID=1427535 RepID=A0A939T661_9ACTN|nr:RDD family protein [Actinomadura barringtoniae]MBO2451523.1 RDD family protein [Actinomadura barringtoniae]
MSDSPHRGRPPYPQQQPGPGQHWQGGQAPSQWQGGQPPPQQQQWQQPPPQQQWQQPQGGGQGGGQGQWQGQPEQQWQRQSFDEVAEAAQLPLAPISRRAGARLMDYLLVSVFGFALILPITLGLIGLDTPGKKGTDDGAIWNWPIFFTMFSVLAVLPFVYEAVQLSLWGRTLGKRVLGLGVVQMRPAGEAITTTQAVWRAAINNLAYQVVVFFFLILAVSAWEYFAYGMLLGWAGALMAYFWAVWDQPLHQALHDRFAGTVVIDERGVYDEEGYSEYDESQYSEYEG